MAEPTPVASPRPQPVVDAAKKVQWIVGLIAALGTALSAFGVVSGQTWAASSGAVVAAITTALGATLPKVLAQGAAAQVTPLESPRSVDGSPLVPEPVSAQSVPAKVSGADVGEPLAYVTTPAPTPPAAAPSPGPIA